MRLVSFLFVCCFFLSACGDQNQARQAKFYAFGTEIDVSLYDVDADTAEQTIAKLEQSFSNVNNTWHAWQPSTLTQINEAIAQGKSIPVSADVQAVIDEAKRYAEQSKHLFNPAAGKLFELWGYHQDNWFDSRPPPAEEQIQQWLNAAPSMNNVQIENGVLSSNNPMVKLGFGAFAKGTAVNSAIESLQQLGIRNAIINIGGDLRAIGRHGERPWVIGIRHPRHEGMLASISLQDDQSVFTSGDYERFFIYEGKRYPHILDPRTGYPARATMSVTVVDQNAAKADAAATALLVAGDDWPRLAASLHVDRVMLMKTTGELEMSPKMAEQTKFSSSSIKPVIRHIPEIATP